MENALCTEFVKPCATGRHTRPKLKSTIPRRLRQALQNVDEGIGKANQMLGRSIRFVQVDFCPLVVEHCKDHPHRLMVFRRNAEDRKALAIGDYARSREVEQELAAGLRGSAANGLAKSLFTALETFERQFQLQQLQRQMRVPRIARGRGLARLVRNG
jgi:hypothetical protein